MASVNPGTVETELASASVTTNRVPHRGHFNRLPALMCSGKFKTTPHCWHWMVRGMIPCRGVSLATRAVTLVNIVKNPGNIVSRK